MEEIICLDTSFIIDFLRNRREAIEAVQDNKNRILATTDINIYEILLGVFSAGKTGQMRVFQKLLQNITVLGLDAGSVHEAAKIGSLLQNEGKIIDDMDILIAGIAKTNNCRYILTGNVKHFDRIKGISAVGYYNK